MRKKTQALTASEKPKDLLVRWLDRGGAISRVLSLNAYSAMYCSCWALEPMSKTVKPAEEGTVLATWAPLRARRRKRDVPTNSPVVAWGEDVNFAGGRGGSEDWLTMK